MGIGLLPGFSFFPVAINFPIGKMAASRDDVALTLGMISVLSWGVAEVPQILTSYKQKSTEGLSIAFLMTWIVGDFFNVAGCLLEPATLPTQFYMALLYTVTTSVLTAQTVYYGHIYRRLKANKAARPHEKHQQKLLYKIEEKGHGSGGFEVNGSSPIEEDRTTTSLPIPVSSPVLHRYGSAGRDLYYMSARSLSKSPAPTWLAHSRDTARTPPTLTHDQYSSREPLLGRSVSAQSAPPSNTKNMLCVVSSAAFILCTYGYHLAVKSTLNTSPHGMIISVGRKLLQVDESSVEHGDGGSEIGTILGWAMAAIYMGGRLPQIWLNIRRGHVEGLSPLMFMFALIGNATYVGSILVNSMDWAKIRPNMPWLVDAGGCVILDAFILIQFVYFRYWKTKNAESRDEF